VDRLTRKELKTDRFAAEFGHTVQFLDRHRREATIAGAALVVIVLAAVGAYFYMNRQHAERQTLLLDVLRTYDARVGPEDPFAIAFPTEEAKREAIQQKLQGMIDTYSGSDEAMIAHFYLGVIAADQNRLEEAETHLRLVVDSGDEEYAAQSALSLATVYAGQERIEEGEQLLRHLIDNPTYLVSSEQATIALAELLSDTKPEEARQLLEPLRGERSAVSQAALTVLAGLETASDQ